MIKITVDQALRQKLGGLGEPVELCSADGRIVGRFLPEDEYRQMLYGSIQIPYSEEEIARRRAQRGGCSLDEIWSD